METLSTLLALSDAKPPFIDGTPHTKPIMRRFDVFSIVSQNKTVQQRVKLPGLLDAAMLRRCRCMLWAQKQDVNTILQNQTNFIPQRLFEIWVSTRSKNKAWWFLRKRNSLMVLLQLVYVADIKQKHF